MLGIHVYIRNGQSHSCRARRQVLFDVGPISATAWRAAGASLAISAPCSARVDAKLHLSPRESTMKVRNPSDQPGPRYERPKLGQFRK